MKKFSLIIPAYNEEQNLPQLLKRTLDSALNSGFNESQFELLIVENGSTDQSMEVLEELVLKHHWQKLVKIVRVVKNQGYGYGLWQGLQQATGEIVGWTHADLQCDPQNAFLAYKKVAQHPHPQILAKGVRSGRLPQDRFVTGVFEFLAFLILGLRCREINAQPKVFYRDLLKHLDQPPSDFAFDLYVLFKAQKLNYDTVTLDVLFPPRIHGVSKWASSFFGKYKTILKIILYMFRLTLKDGRA